MTSSIRRSGVWSRVPPLGRAFLRYFADTRGLDILPIVLLQREVEAEIDELVSAIFHDVRGVLTEALQDGELETIDDEPVRFQYDTRLVLPAMLTLGHLHVMADAIPVRRALGGKVDRALIADSHETTRNVVLALIDGDMRDAINDAEFEDFETNLRPKEAVAERTQAYLARRVQHWFEDPVTPPAVETHYTHAVTVSERHQDEDEVFRGLLQRYLDGASGAAKDIENSYKFATAQDPSALFEDELDLPYFVTQYERVGILYEDMLNMYEADLGVDLGDGFKRAIVLMVIAAQIGLDDTDDYLEDRGTQLTPVTAELNLAPSTEAGVESLTSVVETYLERAADAAPDHLSGMAIEYIRQQSLDRLAALPAVVEEAAR